MGKTKIIMKDNIYDKDSYIPTDCTFENVIKLKENEWSTHVDAETLAKLWIDGKILYLPNAQRGTAIKRNKNGEIEEKAVYSVKNIKAIQTKIVQGDYHPDQITLNVLVDGSDDVAFEDNTLLVDGLIHIIDGQHRVKALANIYQQNLIAKENQFDLKSLIFPVKITNYTVEDAASVFYQYTLGLKISRSLAESFNKKDSINRIVSELNKSGVLKGKIDTVKTSVGKKDEIHITTFATLVSAMQDVYGQIDDEKMENDVLEFLQLFFSELTLVFPELLNNKDRQLSKLYSLVCENFMMYGWIEISQILYFERFNKGAWKDKLHKLREVDFNKLDIDSEDPALNSIWKGVLRLGEEGTAYITNNKTTRQVLRRVLKEQFYKVNS